MYSEKQTCRIIARLSFPRTRESSPFPPAWIPACAGMTFPCGMDDISIPIARPSTCIRRNTQASLFTTTNRVIDRPVQDSHYHDQATNLIMSIADDKPESISGRVSIDRGQHIGLDFRLG